MNLLISFLFIAFLITPPSESDQHQQFLETYSTYCGYAYSGHTTFVNLGSGAEFEDAELTLILDQCEEDVVRIPFHVGGDTSRTWIVKMTPQGLHLSHDHRYEDGSQHDHNFYGGYADEEGSATLQYFPADHRTIEDRPARRANRWAKEFDLDEMKYYYRLYLNDELRLEAEFDLSNPMDYQ